MMINEKKCLLYPYNRSMQGVVKYQDLMKDMKIASLVSPNGWGLVGDRVETLDDVYTVTSDFDMALRESDAVVFMEDGTHILPESVLKKRIEECIAANKEILFARKKVPDFVPENAIVKGKEFAKKIDMSKFNTLFPNDIPIITVAGNFKCADKVEVQLGIRHELLKRGYQVSSIFSIPGGELFGGYSYPSFMGRCDLTEQQKIIEYNHLVRLITSMEKPDAIILGIPGGVLPYSDEIHNDFGIAAFEISNAVNSDFTVFCTLYSENIAGELQAEGEMLKNKYNMEIGAVHVAPYMWDMQDEIGNKSGGAAIELEEEFLYQNITEMDQGQIRNMRRYENIQVVTDMIIEQLS